MLIKVCPKCGKIIPQGQSLCPDCAAKRIPRADKIYDENRDPNIKAFRNSSVWRRKRAYIMERDGYMCKCCHERQATAVHHIVPLWADFSLRLRDDNLISLCDTCHRRADIEANKKWGRGVKKSF